MIRLKTTLLLIAVLASSISFGQTENLPAFRKNSIYYEFGGNGIKSSLNYDRLINWKRVNFKNNFRIGIGYDGSSSEESLQWVSKLLVCEINFIFENKSKQLLNGWEIGLGYSYYLDPIKYIQDDVLKEKVNWSVNFLRLGWRAQTERGLMIRLAVTPTFGREFYNDRKYSVGLWGGISIGYSFNLKKKKE